jgi:hypothetical protein
MFSRHLSDKGVCVFHDTAWNIDTSLANNKRKDMGVPEFVDDLRRQGFPVLTLPHDFGVSLVQTFRNGLPLSAEPLQR